MCSFSAVLFAQSSEEILFNIDDEPVYTSEFERMYNKQIQLMGSSENSKKDYFDLFVVYKLKVKEALDLGLDTLADFKEELAMHQERLLSPYLKDEEASEALIDEAYDRTLYEINASHILIRLKSNAAAQDTLQAFEKISALRKQVLTGGNFEDLAKTYSEDPSAKSNSGNLGYFRAFDMVYAFENAAFNTEIGAVSMPFRTKFGYHIVETNAKRKNLGSREVAHIMLAGNEAAVKQIIDSVYQELLKAPESFEKLARVLSEDKASASSGGKLREIKQDDTVEAFEKVAFELSEEGTFSKPFETEFGWHIVKLLKNNAVGSKQEMYAALKKKVLADGRSAYGTANLVEKLQNKYHIEENKQLIFEVFSENLSMSESDKKRVVLKVENHNYTLEDFILFLKKDKNNGGIDAFKRFKSFAILECYKREIVKTNKEVAATISEFKEGLLLFNLMQEEVWNRSKNESEQRDFYQAHQNKYNSSFENVRGRVISDYQNYLEEQWITRLRKEHTVQINTEVLTKLINE